MRESLTLCHSRGEGNPAPDMSLCHSSGDGNPALLYHCYSWIPIFEPVRKKTSWQTLKFKAPYHAWSLVPDFGRFGLQAAHCFVFYPRVPPLEFKAPDAYRGLLPDFERFGLQAAHCFVVYPRACWLKSKRPVNSLPGISLSWPLELQRDGCSRTWIPASAGMTRSTLSVIPLEFRRNDSSDSNPSPKKESESHRDGSLDRHTRHTIPLEFRRNGISDRHTNHTPGHESHRDGSSDIATTNQILRMIMDDLSKLSSLQDSDKILFTRFYLNCRPAGTQTNVILTVGFYSNLNPLSQAA